jgi:hypothetical protein
LRQFISLLCFEAEFVAEDRSQHRQAAGAAAEALIAVLFGRPVDRCGFVRSTAVEKHELSKIDFEIIENALNALLESRPDPVTADKIADLRDMFRDAYTGWLEIEQAA